MKQHLILFTAVAAGAGALGAIASGCLQPVDGNAASSDGGAAAGNPDAYTTWQICQSPSCDMPNGDIPFMNQTPPIYMPDGSTTLDPCVNIQLLSTQLRQTYCVSCHETPANQGGIDFILDDTRLVGALSQTATDDAGKALPLIVPGDPQASWFYTLVSRGMAGTSGGMPPTAAPGTPASARCTASDLSLFYAWIYACLPGADGGYGVSNGGYPGANDGGGDGEVADGGAVDGHAADGAGGEDGAVDASVHDTGVEDTGPGQDAAPVDAGLHDAGADVELPDTGGGADSAAEAEAPDAGADGGVRRRDGG